ncbi:nucleoside/nucleotide kinase family protein [Arcanobacterium haemolyticum]|uniref:hypothetical protein n=1 Tax=Arcanobacterium haemolyticum TaxID=28264 RepID=UPI000D988370|nr:hypothetical protein [Arcanobacterium haemolyticum]SPT74448.1 shikimate kinase [Arcanobacterium haemolyticum]
MTSVVVIGADGAGKSSVLRALKTYGFLTADVDSLVAYELAVSPEDMFLEVPSEQRRACARRVACDLLADIRADRETRFAVALPADFCDDVELEATCDSLRKCEHVVFLHVRASVDVLMRRLGMFGPRVTNVVLPRKELSIRLEERLPRYEEYADFDFDTSRFELSDLEKELANRVIMLINTGS